MSEAAADSIARAHVAAENRVRGGEGAREVVLVGNPNVGKSALFGALTGTYVTVSNYPGTTVEVTHGHATLDGRRTSVLDTPGTASLLPASEDERVTRDILLRAGEQAVVLVGDAKNLERTLCLAVQLAEARVPFVLCLNMIDEAEAQGLRVDPALLGERLGVEVVPTVAVRHEGLTRLREAVTRARTSTVRPAYPEALEDAVREAERLMPAAPLGPRALALMVLAGDETLTPWLRERLQTAQLEALDTLRERVRRAFPQPIAFLINAARLREATRLAQGAGAAAGRPEPEPRAFGTRLDRIALHPRLGYVLLAAVLLAAYEFVGVFGAGTLVGLLEEGFFEGWFNPAVTRLAHAAVPWAFVQDLLVGPYGLVTMALTYALALVLPIVGTFFIAFGLLEDSGYLPRLAVMSNRLFKSMGLNGKAVLPMVLGLGCDTMATLTTRVLETRKERLIVIVLLALGVPCSAQLAVILAMLGGLSPRALVFWVAIVVGVIVLVGRLAALVLPGRGGDFVLELPPLRLPRPGNIAVKTLARIEWYLKEAVPLFVLGTLILFTADRVGLLAVAQRAAEPVVSGLLGLPKEVAGPFIAGFLRRDFGAAGLYRMARDGTLSHAQILVAAVTITLFIPCIANFFMIVKERGWRTATAIAAFIFPFALLVGALLAALLRAVPALVP
jgi:ferrous iron transport protein B